MAVASAAATAMPSHQGVRLEVGRQARDDDCGAAVLAMLLQSAGYAISETQLERAAGPGRRDARGLSMGDLRQMVEDVTPDLSLAAEWADEQALIERAQATPMIVLLYEQGGRRGSETAALGHFVLIEGWSQSRGFVASDPAIGRRGFITTRELLSSGHQRVRNGVTQILALHLRRAGSPLPDSIPVTLEEERNFRDILELRRLPAGLAPGQAAVSLLIRRGSLRERSPGDEPITLRSRSTSATLMLQYGIDHRQAVSLSVGWGRAGGTIALPGGASFSYRDAAIGPVQLGYTRQLDLAGRENVSASLSASAAFSRRGRPTGGSLGFAAQLQHGRTSFIGALDFSLAPSGRDLSAAAILSAGVARSLGRRANLGFAVTSTMPTSGSAETSLVIFGSVRIGNGIELGAYASQGIGLAESQSVREFGLTVTHALPNLLR